MDAAETGNVLQQVDDVAGVYATEVAPLGTVVTLDDVAVGLFLVSALPKVIKSLSVIGTLALLLVSGGIFVHNIHYLHDLLAGIPPMLAEFIAGLVVGILVLLVVKLFSTLWRKSRKGN